MSKLIQNVSIYSLGNILNRGAMFLLLPLYAHLLKPDDFGKLELVNTIGAVLIILYGLMVENGYSRLYFQKTDKDWRSSLFFTGQTFNVLCSLLFGGSVFLFSREISAQILKFPQGESFLQMITLISLVKVLTIIPFNNIRNRQKAGLFVALNMGYLITNVALTITFLLLLRTGVMGVLYSQLIAGLLELGALYYVTRDENSLKFNYLGLKAMLGFSVFLIPSNLSSFVLNFSNRYFLNEYQNLDQVGLYSLGAKFASIIPLLFTEPVKKAFGPHLYSCADKPDEGRRLIASFSRQFIAGLAIIALFISLFSREAIQLMASTSYRGSNDTVFILAVSYMILGLGAIVVMGIHMSMKTWIVTLIWPLSAGFNIALNILFIPKYGRIGAAWATLLSVIFITGSYFYAVHKVYPVKFDYYAIVKVLGFMVVFNYVGVLIHTGLLLSIILKMLLMSTFCIILIITHCFTKEEIDKALSFASRVINLKRVAFLLRLAKGRKN